MSISFLRVGVWIANSLGSVFSACRRGKRTAVEVYTLLTSNKAWLINTDGQFILKGTIGLAEGPTWTFADDVLRSSENESVLKKIPLLSCEFKQGSEDVSLDDFIETVRFTGELPPWPVVMAAYTIHTNKVYSWRSAKFSAFDRQGAQIEFTGATTNFPVG
jgi:hypothetical protein